VCNSQLPVKGAEAGWAEERTQLFRQIIVSNVGFCFSAQLT